MKTVLHKADSRGLADHGWLRSYHTFSFANYYNPERMHFGTLRVLNDDEVAAGRGFGRHPHENMEIISIPLSGDLQHEDSMGNVAVIRQGDIQAMSAGTGITHSEMNASKQDPVSFLQIWVFPKTKNITPNYSQITLEESSLQNQLYQIVSPFAEDEGVQINQDAWFHLGELTTGKKIDYNLKKKGNGVYVFLLEGSLTIGDQELSRRDGMGVWDTDSLHITATNDAKVLLMEIPMERTQA
ncbi:pirin family protein [Neolewinella agarilytica]|uniref:pirin family protein n=1 Tax=Neolewinella agarilytica TaxID=478744 RepID=UPI002357BC7A|nr:pirin family protein [Neolewinella agarilytica]